MKATGPKKNAGFSLIELMTVVAVLGVLTTVAAPELVKYVRKSRTVEVVTAIAKIAQGARIYHDTYRALPCTEPVDANDSCEAHVDPTPSTTHADACNGHGGFMPPNSAIEFAVPVWRSLLFQPEGNTRYRYAWESYMVEGIKARATITGIGDLDCDGELSIWNSFLKTDKNGEIMLIQQMPTSQTDPLE